MIIPTIILRTTNFDYFNSKIPPPHSPKPSNCNFNQPMGDISRGPDLRKLKKICKTKTNKAQASNTTQFNNFSFPKHEN